MLISGLLITSPMLPAEIPSAGEFTLSSGKYVLKLDSAAGWAVKELSYDGHAMILNRGANGSIFSEYPNQYQGCDRNEKTVQINVSADGKPASLNTGEIIKGNVVLIERETRIANLLFSSRLQLSLTGLEWRTRYRSTDAQPVTALYLYALSFSPELNEFYAKAAAGNFLSGNFQNKGGWQINSDLNWVALYMPAAQLGMMVYFPEVIPAAGRKSTFWDLAVYHKFYLQLKTPEKIPAGYASPEYVTRFQAFAASSAGEWTMKATEEAKKMDKEFNKKESFAERKLNPTPIPDFGPVDKEDWATNRRGIEALSADNVLPPFDPVKTDGQTVTVWGRRYQLGQSGLIEQVKIIGEDYLSHGITPKLIINGKPVQWIARKAEIISSGRGRVQYRSVLEAAELTWSALTTVEYDGMVRIDLKLIPKKAITLDHFSYEAQLSRENAKFVHFIGAPEVINHSIMIPSESFSFKLPENDGIHVAESFKSLLWLGNHEKGLLWFAPSMQNWWPHDPARTDGLMVSSKGGVVALTVSPVVKPMPLNHPVNYTFGFFATPVRPMTPGWRGWVLTTRLASYGSEMAHGYKGNCRLFWPDEYRTISEYWRFTTEKLAKFQKLSREIRSEGAEVLPYIDPIRAGLGLMKYVDQSPSAQLNDMNIASPDTISSRFIYQTPEPTANLHNWQTVPQLIYGYSSHRGECQARVSSASSWADFFLYGVEQIAKAGATGFGDIDNCFPIKDMNEAHGSGYIGQDGKRYPEWDWFARRDLMKRMAQTFINVNGKAPLLIAHSSATWSIPFISFCDANMTFEHSNSGYFSNEIFLSKYGLNNEKISADIKTGAGNYLKYAFPVTRWQAELTGHQFGLPCIIMSNLTKSPAVDKTYASSAGAARELVAFAAVHDNIFWPIWCNTRPIIDWLRIRERFGIAAPEVKFYPYWSKKTPLTCETSDIYLAIYQRAGSYLAVVSNLGETARDAAVKFPGISGVFTVENAETGQMLSSNDGELKLEIGPRDYRILTLKTK